jgi:hypothetical protein
MSIMYGYMKKKNQNLELCHGATISLSLTLDVPELSSSSTPIEFFHHFSQ